VIKTQDDGEQRDDETERSFLPEDLRETFGWRNSKNRFLEIHGRSLSRAKMPIQIFGGRGWVESPPHPPASAFEF
jgi:hypothetical protein